MKCPKKAKVDDVDEFVRAIDSRDCALYLGDANCAGRSTGVGDCGIGIEWVDDGTYRGFGDGVGSR